MLAIAVNSNLIYQIFIFRLFFNYNRSAFGYLIENIFVSRFYDSKIYSIINEWCLSLKLIMKRYSFKHYNLCRSFLFYFEIVKIKIDAFDSFNYNWSFAIFSIGNSLIYFNLKIKPVDFQIF